MRKQILIVIYGYFISDIIDFLFNLTRAIFLKGQFELLEFKVDPTRTLPVILFNILNISNTLPVVCNYLAFYYLVKEHFSQDNRLNIDSKVLLDSQNEELNSRKRSIGTKDIDDFLN